MQLGITINRLVSKMTSRCVVTACFSWEHHIERNHNVSISAYSISEASCGVDDADVSSAAPQPEKCMKIAGYYEPEELARMILEESADAVEPFGSLEEMIEYIREAMNADYAPVAGLRMCAAELQGGQDGV